MLQTLKLLIPALIPSWRFFDTIAPSPRIEFTLLETALEAAPESDGNWREFRPRPARLTVGAMLKRMFWNPRWNETLFLVSCAERLMQFNSDHAGREILSRITAELVRDAVDVAATPYVQFRLVFLSREGARIEKHITFTSPVHPVSGNAVR